MKMLAYATLGFTLLTSGNAFAMGQSLPKSIQDELVSRAQVHANFNLRAEDGSLISLETSKSQSGKGLKNLPAEKGADRSKCGKNDIDTIIALTDATLHLIQQGALTSSDIRVIQKTPRCEPYLDLLGSLGNLLDRSESVEQDLPEKLSVVKLKKSYAMQLKMKSGRTALFQIAAKLDGIKSLKDLERVRFDSSTTGQNIGVRFAVTDVNVTDPTRSRAHESCTVYETRRGKTVARPGHRNTVSQTTFTSYSIAMTLTASNGTPVMTAELGDGDFDTITRDGTCYPD